MENTIAEQDKNTIPEHIENINNNLEHSKNIIQILNEYILFFNSDNNSYGKTFFDGLSTHKVSETNLQMETFYRHMTYFKDNDKKDYTNVYSKLSEINIEKGEIIYGIFKESTMECIAVSYSLFAILIEIVNVKNIKKNNKYFIKEIKV